VLNESEEIIYKTADGKWVCLDVSMKVKNLLVQADRQIRSQRRQERRRHTEYIEGLTNTSNVRPQEDFADLISRMDSYKRLYSAIKKLPDTQRRRISMYYFKGMTYQKIAESHGVHHATVMRSVAQARHTLKQLLQ
jgi:RNA polymerase sigma-70 factor (ECF subfamily)